MHARTPRLAPPAERIPLFRSRVTPDAIAAASAVLASGWLGAGEQVRRFEAALAERLDARHCVAVATGTAAVHVALAALDLPAGAEVVTTPVTWIATHNAIAYVGARAVPADVDPATGNLDADAVERAITPRTAAILAVHYAGTPCDLGALRAVAARAGVPLVEDAAHAFGSTYRDAPIGGADNLQTFSFGPTKNLTTIHGGAVTTNDDALADRVRTFSSLDARGSAAERRRRGDGAFRSSYDIDTVGFRYELPDVNAAVGLAQLAVVDEENARRAAIAARYDDELREVPGLALLSVPPGRTSAHHLFGVLVDGRADLAAALLARGIETGVHYPPNPLVESDPADVPHATSFAERILTLPLHPSLSDDDVDRVTSAVRDGW